MSSYEVRLAGSGVDPVQLEGAFGDLVRALRSATDPAGSPPSGTVSWTDGSQAVTGTAADVVSETEDE